MHKDLLPALADSPAEAAGQPTGHFLHVFPSFGLGGVPIRIANVINHLGPNWRHTIVALDNCYDCRDRLAPEARVETWSSQCRKNGTLRAVRHARAVIRRQAPDLLLTYNWGSIEWALASLLDRSRRHVHFESGFGREEADLQLTRRVIMRRMALARAARLVVPSHTLVRIARETWKFAPERIVRIPNGINCARFAQPPDLSLIPDLPCPRSRLTLGTVAPLRPEKNISRLLRAFASLATALDVRLVIVGDGAERRNLSAAAETLGLSQRVTFAGHIDQVHKVFGLLDVFALTSDTEQMPNSLIQAMAAGLPVVATDVGDVRHMLPGESQRYVVPKADEAALLRALVDLLSDPAARARLGACNQAHARREFDEAKMFDSYAKLFAELLE